MSPTVARSFGKKAAALVGSCIVCLAILEGLSRYLFHELTSYTVHFSSEFEFDRETGWRAKRQWVGALMHGRYPVPIDVSINADGFRDDDWGEKLRRAQTLDRKKILMLGDSVLYGFAGAKSDRLTEILAAGYDAEVFNAGIPGFGPAQEYRVLPELLDMVHPDVVFVIFSANDYADTGLPFDHRFPFRVYKPFYDSSGALFLNGEVPKRPSLWAQSTPFANLSLWLSLDRVSYALDDIRYRRASIMPDPEDLRYFGEWENFFFDDSLRARYPYVAVTVLRLYERMRQAVEAAGGRFYVVSTSRLVNDRLAKDLRGSVNVVPFPAGQVGDPWLEIPMDGHFNHVWSSVLAYQIADVLGAARPAWSWDEISRHRDWPEAIDMTDPGSVQYLTGAWEFSEASHTFVLKKPGGVIFHNPGGPIEVTGYATGNVFGKMELAMPDVAATCAQPIDRHTRRFSCRFPPNSGAVLPVAFWPATPELEISLSAIEVRSAS